MQLFIRSLGTVSIAESALLVKLALLSGRSSVGKAVRTLNIRFYRLLVYLVYYLLKQKIRTATSTGGLQIRRQEDRTLGYRPISYYRYSS